MAATIEKEGQYELFRTTEGNRILVLEDDYFAVVEGQKGEMLVGTDSDHQRGETIQSGAFKLVSFEDDAKFQDIPHLFLEREGKYHETLVPRGLPREKGGRERFIYTDNRLELDEVERYLSSPEQGPGSERRGRPGGGAAANVTHHLRGMDFPADRKDLLEHARSDDAPSDVMEQLEKLESRRYDSMADVLKGLGASVQEGRPPLEGYDQRRVREILSEMGRMDREGIERVRDYEEERYGRKTILRRAEQLLEEKEPPTEGYFDLSAEEMEDRIRQMKPEELDRLREFEEGHQNRKTVLQAIDRERRSR